jgi:phage terminase large subunit
MIFNKDLFNPNFWHFYDSAKNSDYRTIFGYGGSSSSKTYSLVQCVLILTLEEACDTIVLRKIQTTISRSIFKDFETIIKIWKLESYFRIIKSNLRIECTATGNAIDFTGLDDPEKIKGISQYKRVILEELSEFTKQDFDQIRKRLRGKKGQQIISLFNPIDENHWIKKKLFDLEEKNYLPTFLEDGRNKVYTQVAEKWTNSHQQIVLKDGSVHEMPPNMVVIRSTYQNNFWVVGSPKKRVGFVDYQVIADFEKDKKTDYNFYKIYALGMWGKISVGGECYKKFSPHNHISKKTYNDSLPLHISLDENVNPYLTLTVYQIEIHDGLKSVIQIDEICLESPRNRVKDVCKEFTERYKHHISGVFVYGDATSQKEDTKLEKGQNFFTLVLTYLEHFKPQKRVPLSNPSVSMRINFINEIFDSNLYGINIEINENCEKSINDLNYCKEDENGGKLKSLVKDKIRNITYQEYGHTSDTLDYFICEVFKNEYYDYQRGGRKPATSYKIGGNKKGRF